MTSLRWPLALALLGLFVSAGCGSSLKPKCLPSNCAGCCDTKGECVTQVSVNACGQRGSACSICVGDQVCLSGFCSGSANGGGTGDGEGGGSGGTGGGNEPQGGGEGMTGGGGGSSGGGTGGGGMTGGGGGGKEDTAAQISAVRKAATPAPSTVSLSIQGALVTFIKPFVPGAAPEKDSGGFFIQAGVMGPALFVAVDAASVPVAVGDRISLDVTGVIMVGNLRAAISISNVKVESTGNDIKALIQTVSSVNFAQADAIDEHECELISVSGSLSSSMVESGGGFQSADLTTTGTSMAGVLKLRLPNALAESEKLEAGCTVQLAGVPLWRFDAQAQPSPFAKESLTGTTCPAPRLVSATSTSSKTVVVLFDRPMDVASLTPTNMKIDGLTVTAVTGSDKSWVVSTSNVQTPAANYTVTATSVTDLRGTPIDPLHNTANFTGFQPPTGHIVINEVDYDNPGAAEDSAEFIELLNPTSGPLNLIGRSVVLVNGASTVNAIYTTIDLSAAGSLGAGEYLVIASAATLSTVPSTAKKVEMVGATGLIQNGAPDAVVLVDTTTSTIIDSLSYEGEAFWGSVSVLEGDVVTSDAESNTTNDTYCRHPNGADTDSNYFDFYLCAAPTPGAANVR